MHLPTEPIGSIPRPLHLIEAITGSGAGTDTPELEALYMEAIRDTLAHFEGTGSPVITDREQRKYHNLWTYCLHGLPNTSTNARIRARVQGTALAERVLESGDTHV